ncbi:putative serine hydrolase FSH, alpha/Beta hydrolase [Helianthus anomalus]
MENEKQNKKLKILCLHGFRTSGAILQKEVEKWPQPLLQKLDLVFMDGPYPAQGKSGLDGIFEPPFYE